MGKYIGISSILIVNNLYRKYNISTNRNKHIFIKTIDKISIIIPFYNEELSIKNTLNKITNIGIKGELLLINNCSTDKGTFIVDNFIDEYNGSDLEIHQLFCSEKGKGNAIILGLEKAVYETILLTDADGEYEINEYPKLINKYFELDNKYIQVVATTRSTTGLAQKRLYAFSHDILLGTNYSMYKSCHYISGTRIFPRNIILTILNSNLLTEKGFGIDNNITYELYKFGKTYNLPISYNRRTEEGKKLVGKEKQKFKKDSVKFVFKNLINTKNDNLHVGLINTNTDNLHIGIIMDGNRRFTKKIKGIKDYQHLIGLIKLQEIIGSFKKNLNVKYLTLYCFAENNWKRENEEIDNIFNLLSSFLIKYRKNHNNIVINILSTETKRFSYETINSINEIHKISSSIKEPGLYCNLLLSYSGKKDIVNAVEKVKLLKNNDLDINTFKSYLLTGKFPEINIVVRTGGDSRLSDFALYDCAYSEFVVLDKTFPELSIKDLNKIIKEYYLKKKNFGK